LPGHIEFRSRLFCIGTHQPWDAHVSVEAEVASQKHGFVAE
jgi:hypothetical protein